MQPFTNKAAFHSWISEPIKHVRPNSLRRLEDLVRATCLRRKKSTNSASFKLPQRSEKIREIDLLSEDRELYTFFKRKTAEIASKSSQHHSGAGKIEQRKDTNILTLINVLRLICDHGEHLLPPPALEAWKARESASIDWQTLRACRGNCNVCGITLDESDAVTSASRGSTSQHTVCQECSVQNGENDAESPSACSEYVIQTAGKGTGLVSQLPQFSTRPSAKVDALIRNLRQEQCSGEDRPLKR